jgi:hypothetical protein
MKGMIIISINDMNELMRIQASTLYVLDDEDKIVSVNEPGQISTPLIFFGMTRNATFKFFKSDLSQPLIDEINRITQSDVSILNVCKILEKYKSLKNVWIGPAYSFPEIVSTNSDQNIFSITDYNRHYLARYFSNVYDNYEYIYPALNNSLKEFKV